MSHGLNAIVVVALLATLPGVGRAEPRSALHVLLEAHDADGDGKIATVEYGGSDRTFARLDVDGDGWITEADLSSPESGRRAIDSMMGDVIGWLADRDKDDTISAAEWRVLLAELDADGDGIAGTDALVQAGLDGPMLGGIVALLDQDRGGALQIGELQALFARLDDDGDGALTGDEIVNWRAARLLVGDPAPLFELRRAGAPEQTVRLADFRGKRPVALIFGSYT